MRHLRRMALVCLVATLAHAGPVAAADPAQAFADAERAYERGRYSEVIALLRPLLAPENRLPTKSAFIQAHKMLAISLIFEKQPLPAEQSLLAILAERPDFQLDPLVDPKAAVTLLSQVRRRSAQMLSKLEQAQREERARQAKLDSERQQELARLRKLAAEGSEVVERQIVRRSYWLNFLPLGVGQFQNGQRLKGFILLGTQLALGGASLGAALAHRIQYPSGTLSPAQQSGANALQTTQLATGLLFWVAVAYGIIDALVNYQSASWTETRRRRLSGWSPPPNTTAGPPGVLLRF